MELALFTAIEENEQLKGILKVKFSEVAKELHNVMKVASKGQRKGLIIFKQDAPALIYAIEDKFVQYIVRSIFDNYSDKKNGIIWRMHCNEMFNADFVKSVFRKLSHEVDMLENEYEEMRKKHLHNEELSRLNNINTCNYSFFMLKRYKSNVFNLNNEKSPAFYDAYNALKSKVKKEHSRVPDDKMDAYIEKDYFYREEKENIEKAFLNSIPEYVTMKARISEIYDLQHKEEKELRERINIELEKLDYKAIQAGIKKMVEQFIEVVLNSIMTGTINF
jgi:hypothetical protein